MMDVSEGAATFHRLALDRRKQLLGAGFVVLVAVIWVTFSFVVKEVEGQGLHPFLLSYIANSLFVVYLPLHWAVQRSKASKLAKPRPQVTADEEVPGGQSDTLAFLPDNAQPSADVSKLDLQPQTAPSTFAAAVVVAPLWFLAQLSFNFSLGLTSVTSNTILSSTSSLFTYAAAIALRQDAFQLQKVGAIGLCMAGTALVTFVDNKAPPQAGASVWGDALCLLSACFYAAYTVAIRKMLPEDESAPMMLFFGYVGLLNLACLAPVLGLLVLGGVVDLRALTGKLLGATVLKGLFDNALSDYFWARAVLLIGPAAATTGLSLQVPVAVAADMAFTSPPWLHNGYLVVMLLGAAATVVGFVGMNLTLRWCKLRSHAAVISTVD